MGLESEGLRSAYEWNRFVVMCLAGKLAGLIFRRGYVRGQKTTTHLFKKKRFGSVWYVRRAADSLWSYIGLPTMNSVSLIAKSMGSYVSCKSGLSIDVLCYSEIPFSSSIEMFWHQDKGLREFCG